MQQFRRTAMELPPIPPSPTLTNPDMILPHDHGLDSTASPLPRTVDLPSHMFHGFDGPGAYVVAAGAAAEIQPSADTSDVVSGTLDIGTEEGILKAPYRVKQHDFSASQTTDLPLASSPTLANLSTNGMQPTIKSSLERLRRLASKESLLFNSDGSMNAKELRKLVSSGNISQHDANDHDEPSGDEDGPDSHAALSSRAEMILANAKKRLDAMEGNLNRARRSLMLSPSSAMFSSSTNSSSTTKQSPLPSLPSNEHRARSALDIPPTRQSRVDASWADAGPGHTRVFSETSLPSSTYDTNSSSHQVPRKPRSIDRLNGVQSSLESSHRTVERGNWEAPARAPLRPVSASGDRRSVIYAPRSQQGLVLQPLTEDEPTQGLGIYGEDGHWNKMPRPDGGLARSQSTTQMNDLRLQMRDLKGKISSLQRRAREDGLRRRSLQSLREVTPFSSAEEWSDPSGRASTSTWHKSNGTSLPQENIIVSGNTHIRNGSTLTDLSSEIGPDDSISVNAYRKPRARKTTESLADSSEDEDDFYSINDYEEVHAISPGARHEDRADAFNYEHSFLHSGLGRYAPALRDRRDSLSSTDSVETTKGPDSVHPHQQASPAESFPGSSPTDEIRAPPSRLHRREKSKDSLSSMATFLTATEGVGPDDEAHPSLVNGSSPPRVESVSSRYIRAVGGPYALGETSMAPIKPPAAAKQPIHTSIPQTAISSVGADVVGPQDKSAEPAATPRLFPLVRNGHAEDAPQHSSAATALLSAILADTGLTGHVLPSLRSDDLVVVDKIIGSLRRVCAHLAVENSGSDSQMRQLWRSRLENARKILDGESGDEIF
ncbi:hypothetical protein L228DRAFT_8903 [Xylona heveae TC161]|uniref:Uncharacterized protein n=1 Tax=Xylona heveae (strain CBS 132557 / TC161) TaxID=1328760 RepID=A0A165JI92_XYLHT|nr:hypothetical protein L228DRAFT_8903 [Xylona heveae TC161]KZF26275.1 hypothetical protein L228DRAFT_8903 [Xylona heveae TC161]